MKILDKNPKNDSLCSLIFENSAEAILVTDANGKIIQANPSCFKLFEYSSDELVGLAVEKLIPLELEKIHIAHREDFAKNPESRKIHSGLNFNGIKKSGIKIPLEIGLSYGNLEQDLFVICFISDISDRQNWFYQFRDQQKLLRKYLDVTSSIFLILDSKGNIVLINKVGSETLGTTEKEAIGKNWIDNFIDPDEKESVRKTFKKMINGKTKDTNTFENHIINFEGKKRLIEWSNTVLRNKNGSIDAVLSNGIDITERRESEDARTEAIFTGQEMERRRLAQELHDGLGQAISAIGLNMNALEPELENFNIKFKGIYSELKEKLNNAFDEIKTISKNLTPKILEDYGLSRALKYLGETLDNSTAVELNFSLHGDLDTIDSKVSLSIYRSVQELLSNALRHANANKINVYVTRSKKSILVIVEDDGNGFDPDKLTLGFGISNLKSRVELLKGKLDIDSNDKGGTSISINIPL